MQYTRNPTEMLPMLQEKADHRLKERLEETVFWSEEVEAEVMTWAEEKFKLAEVISCTVL